MITCIIIDDEPIAHRVLQNHLDAIGNVQNIGDFYNAIDAKEFLITNKVDFIFLDGRIQTDNWEAIKSSGTLSLFPSEKLFWFTKAYGELSRNYSGTNTDDFLIYVIYVRDNYVNDTSVDVKILNRLARNILGNLEMKLAWFDKSCEEILKY